MVMDLPLTQVNIVHTSDIHSWYLGHQKDDDISKSWNADIGDVISFELGQDLFFVDTGDQTHGGGLSDAEESVPGAATLKIQAQMPYDVMTPGNHELEHPDIAKNLYNVIRDLGPEAHKYLASNVYINISHALHPLASQYRIWHPTWNNSGGQEVHGHKVTALGLMFDPKKRAAPGLIAVEPMESMVTQNWFQDIVLKSNPKMFLLVGHISLSDEGHPEQWRIVHQAIRKEYPFTPIFILAGHSHRRDCMLLDSENKLPGSDEQWPDRSIAIEASFLANEYHSDKGENNFPTDSGNRIVQQLRNLATTKALTTFYGCAPRTYAYDHATYSPDSESHALAFYMNEVVPEVILKKTNGELDPYVLLLNWGLMRGPIYQGRYTKDDKYVNMPKPDPFVYMKVPRLVAERVMAQLESDARAMDMNNDNDYNDASQRLQSNLTTTGADRRPHSIGRYVNQAALQEIVAEPALVPGYATLDRCLGKLGRGDDVLHFPALKIQLPPQYVQTTSQSFTSLGQHDLVDFVTTPYLKRRVLNAMNTIVKLHNEYTETVSDILAPVTEVLQYGDIDTTDAVAEYAERKWRKDC
ncbi:hypothetical protein FRB97_005855 [Tulasnella sp. 331]|nr:hypothetical protein FRB97_005855 [Tulasnella sp. 331]